MEWLSNKIIGIGGIILGVIILFYPSIIKWIKRTTYISYNDAIKKIGGIEYYNIKNHTEMWEEMGQTQGSFYEEQLRISIKKGHLPIYGYKVYSLRNKLEKIEVKEFNRLHFNDQHTSLLSILNEETYTDIKFKKKELYRLINKLKSEFIK